MVNAAVPIHGTAAFIILLSKTMLVRNKLNLYAILISRNPNSPSNRKCNHRENMTKVCSKNNRDIIRNFFSDNISNCFDS